MAIKTFSIFGEIVDSQSERWGYDDVCPDMFNYFLQNEVEDGDDRKRVDDKHDSRDGYGTADDEDDPVEYRLFLDP